MQLYSTKSVEPRFVAATQEANGSGRLTIRIPMTTETSGEGMVYPLPQAVPMVPGFGFSGAVGKEEASGAWSWELTYLGLGPLSSTVDNASGQILYKFTPSDMEASVVANPNFAAIKAKYGTPKIQDDGTFDFPANMPGAAQSGTTSPADLVNAKGGNNPAQGNTSYLSFGGVLTKSYTVSGSLPAAIWQGVEQIVQGLPPEIPAWLAMSGLGNNRNWLKKMPDWQAKGLSISIVESWLLSGLGGFIPEFYAGPPA